MVCCNIVTFQFEMLRRNVTEDLGPPYDYRFSKITYSYKLLNSISAGSRFL